jgi:hypothetical protein
MWSLPDIKRLNEEAVKNAPKVRKAVETGFLDGTRITCDWCDETATYLYPWYDVFSEIPKGIIGLCDEHDHYYGSPSEGFFICDDCGRVFITNYTWEYYFTDTEEGDQLCLNCAFDRYVKEKDNWLTSIEELDWQKISSSPHIIPVSGNHWGNCLTFVGNVEFDKLTGEKIIGFSSTSTKDDGLNELRELVQKALTIHKKCILILDAAYQFAVSIGVYVKK